MVKPKYCRDCYLRYPSRSAGWPDDSLVGWRAWLAAGCGDCEAAEPAWVALMAAAAAAAAADGPRSWPTDWRSCFNWRRSLRCFLPSWSIRWLRMSSINCRWRRKRSCTCCSICSVSASHFSRASSRRKCSSLDDSLSVRLRSVGREPDDVSRTRPFWRNKLTRIRRIVTGAHREWRHLDGVFFLVCGSG